MWLKQYKPPIWEWFLPPITMVMTGGWFVVETIINHPFETDKHATYKDGDDWGMACCLFYPHYVREAVRQNAR